MESSLGQVSGADREAVARLVRQLGQFDGSLEKFLANLLTVQCFLSQAEGGAILRVRSQDGGDLLALYPQPRDATGAPAWLARAVGFAREALEATGALVKPLPEADHRRGEPVAHHVVLVGFRLSDLGPLVAVFLVESSKGNVLEARRVRLELLGGLTALFEGRLGQVKQERQDAVVRLQKALEILSVVNRHRRFAPTGMAFCNEVASQYGCERVSLGFLRGRYVHLKAMSHTEDFTRKMKAVQNIEAAMEECLDQDTEILHPPAGDATYVSRTTGELAAGDGPPVVLSLPLRREGEALAVVTMQRPAGRPFDLREIETVRLACDLCTPRLLHLHERDRWFGARAAAAARSALAILVGPRHTWAKVAGLLVFAAIAFLILAKGEYRPEAAFVLEATENQVVPAPFDGYLKEVNVEVGELVEAGRTSLALLDTAELRLQLAAAEAERAGHLKQAAAAMRDGQTAQAQIAQANADKVGAEIDLLKYRVERAAIRSPISGVVVVGDLKREIGAPVKIGDILFEVARLESLRAELLMPEDQVVEIEVGQKGSLATASYPGHRIEFVVERIHPAAEVVNQRNVFKVRVRLLEILPWMRPGMEGIAKVEVGKRRYAWIWTRRIANWIRMKLWL